MAGYHGTPLVANPVHAFQMMPISLQQAPGQTPRHEQPSILNVVPRHSQHDRSENHGVGLTSLPRDVSETNNQTQSMGAELRKIKASMDAQTKTFNSLKKSLTGGFQNLNDRISEDSLRTRQALANFQNDQQGILTAMHQQIHQSVTTALQTAFPHGITAILGVIEGIKLMVDEIRKEAEAGSGRLSTAQLDLGNKVEELVQTQKMAAPRINSILSTLKQAKVTGNQLLLKSDLTRLDPETHEELKAIRLSISTLTSAEISRTDVLDRKLEQITNQFSNVTKDFRASLLQTIVPEILTRFDQYVQDEKNQTRSPGLVQQSLSSSLEILRHEMAKLSDSCPLRNRARFPIMIQESHLTLTPVMQIFEQKPQDLNSILATPPSESVYVHDEFEFVPARTEATPSMRGRYIAAGIGVELSRASTPISSSISVRTMSPDPEGSFSTRYDKAVGLSRSPRRNRQANSGTIERPKRRFPGLFDDDEGPGKRSKQRSGSKEDGGRGARASRRLNGNTPENAGLSK